MEKFVLAADSGCDLSYDICKERNIYPYFMSYEKNGKTYTDTMRERDIKEFYGNMKNGYEIHTSAINIGEYINFWTELIKLNSTVVHIVLGSAISSSYRNACIAKEEFENENKGAKIYLVDSSLASAGYGMLVMNTASLRDGGASAEECVKYAESIKHKIHALYTTDDLSHLHRGGRVKKTGAVIARTLGIMPVLNLNFMGELKVFGICRGRKSAYSSIISEIKNNVVNPETQTLYISHSDCICKAENLGNLILENVGFKDVYYTYIGSTVGAHAGPELVSVFFIGTDRK